MSDNPIHVAKIAREIKLQPNQVRAVRALLADDATVPFIARYRKEATGSLDEVQITAIRDRLEQLEELDQRREAIIKSLGERGLLTEELGKKLAAAETMTVLEDIYLPLRPKRRTRARLLGASMETEARIVLKKRADEEAIQVFSENVRELLMAAPLGRKKVLAIDPGFRTGCKIVCLDPQGQLLHHDVVYPEQGARNADEAATKIRGYCERFGIEAIAIGNGTGGRETEMFVRGLGLPKSIVIVMVNESGASVYSASELARQEFSNQDLTVRGAVSIGRRLMDPLAELVKIDPKSIGVGQYQHDVDQRALKRSLDDVVMRCVNSIGVELNTASPQILAYVSGLNAQLAENIVAHRNANGPFLARQQLLKVPRLGPKAFQQAAGFLRIRDGTQPLDASAVHPESYYIVDRMAADRGCTVRDLMRDDSLRKGIRL